MKPTLARELVLDAILMAVWRRKPKQKVLIHSDQGTQYSSDDWMRFCREHNLEPSMSRRGNSWDNAVAESFFHTLKTELTHHLNFKTKENAKLTIFEYIEIYYNKKRMHSANDYLAPAEFENRRMTC